MNGRIRRGLVVLGTIACLVVGIVSIQLAANLAAAAAPPPAPPISLETLKTQLVAEQDRAAALQQELADLLDVTDQLVAALETTQAQVDVDGSAATDLRDRLKAAEDKLATVNALLEKAKARLAALGRATAGLTPDSGTPSSGGGGGGTGGGKSAKATPTPAPPASATFSLSVAIANGQVRATWSTCSSSAFYAYALVRSTDREIHYPPEDKDTLVAEISTRSTTTTTDSSAPAQKTVWYRLYCLSRHDNENKVLAVTSTVQITAP